MNDWLAYIKAERDELNAQREAGTISEQSEAVYDVLNAVVTTYDIKRASRAGEVMLRLTIEHETAECVIGWSKKEA